MKNGLTELEIEQAKALGVRFYESPEEQELDYLREALKRTPEERFCFLMKLMKMQETMKQAKWVNK